MGEFSDLLDFFTGGGETETGSTQAGEKILVADKEVSRLSDQTSQLGQTIGQTDQIRRLSEEGEAGGLAGLERILGLQSGGDLLGAGRDAATNLSGTIEGLQTRAAGLPGQVNALTQPIVAEARRGLEDQLSQQTTRLSAGAGSRLNSFVNTAEAEGRADLESQLASISAQAGLSGLQLQSQDLLGAGGLERENADLFRQLGLGEGAIEGDVGGTISQLLTSLRGATETKDSRTETQQTQNLSNLISEFTNALELGKTRGSTTGFTDPSGSFANFASGLESLLKREP